MRAIINPKLLDMSELDVTHLPALRLKRNEDRRLQAGHLWVFSNEVDTQQTPLNKLKPGELVRVLAHNDRALGLAYANPSSLITARLLETWTIPDARWFEARLRTALASARAAVRRSPTTARSTARPTDCRAS